MSNMKRCEQGHYYDADRYSTCPNCGVQGLDIQPTYGRSSAAAGDTGDPPGVPRTRGQQEPPRRLGAEGKTIGIIQKQTGINPVLGWLMCIEGAERGRDYRIRGERCSIGRDPSMEICISGDETISRHKHAVISFNPKNNSFKIVPGDGSVQTYLNGEVVDMPMPLKNYDLIEMGQTKLAFIAFCGDQFQWE